MQVLRRISDELGCCVSSFVTSSDAFLEVRSTGNLRYIYMARLQLWYNTSYCSTPVCTPVSVLYPYYAHTFHVLHLFPPFAHTRFTPVYI